MESGRSSGCVYRLVVEMPGRAVVYDAAPFPSRKRAIAHVAAAVRRYAPQGDVATVTLEQAELRHRSRSPGASPGNGNGHWTTLERWDGVVVQRILEQSAAAIGRDPHGTSAATLSVPLKETVHRPGPPADAVHPAATASAVACAAAIQHAAEPPAPAVEGARTEPHRSRALPAGPRGRQVTRKGHRWHTAVMLVLAGLVWVALAVLLAGGHLISLFTDVGPARPKVVIDLPFDAPASTSPSPAVTPPDGSGAGGADGPTAPAPTANDAPSLILFRPR